MSTVRYPINFPREGRDRGLGYTSAGRTLSGMGSWVVDSEWGRGAFFSPDHPRPYPASAHPTTYPRAGAARVLGTSNAPVVGRPFAATRLPTMGHPLHRTPVIAPGATLRNPGMFGVAEIATSFAALGSANVLAPAGLGLAIGLGGQVAGLSGTARNLTGFAALGAIGWAAWQAYRNWRAMNPEEVGGVGPAQAGARVGESVAAVAIQAVQAESMTDAQRRQILASFSCYENAKRAQAKEGLWARFTGSTVRNPLADCGLTQAQATAVQAAFAKISIVDRVRMMPGTFGPGGPLDDLGR